MRDELVEPPRAPDLTPERERLRDLYFDLRPGLRAPARVKHHAQDAVDAEPGMPDVGISVVHFAFGSHRNTSAVV